MTTVTNTLCFTGYPFQALDSDLAKAIAEALPGWASSSSSLLIRLEAFLQMTGRTLRLDQLATNHGRVVLTQFLSVLPASLSQKVAYTFFTRLRLALSAMNQSTLDDFSLPFQAKMRPEILSLAAEADALLIPERVAFWRGWIAKNKYGDQVLFRLFPMYERLGPTFTSTFFRACEVEVLRGCSKRLPCINQLAVYIKGFEGEITAAHFEQDSRWLYEFLKDFCIDLVLRSHAKENQIFAVTREWKKCASFLEQSILGKIWAPISRSLPRPRAPKVEGADTRIVRRDDGVDVRNALLTDVPLHVSDKEAKEILFKSIRTDLDTIASWARKEVSDAWTRYQRRLELAPKGIISEPGAPGKNTGLDWRLSRAACPNWLAHAAATFQSRGIVGSFEKPHPAAYYPQPLTETTWELGLPTPNLLLAFASILIVNHPQITSSFLEHLEVIDKHGRDAGLVVVDGGKYLVGIKPRKGSLTSEQKIKLNEETTRVVEQVIELTAPLRQYMRNRNIPTWRRMLLAMPTIGSTPKFWFAAGVSSRAAVWLAGRLVENMGAEPVAAFERAKRFTLRSLRASAAVAVYLETGSLQKFSEALGHEKVDPVLLDSYLPEPVQQWFMERWVRLFQTGMIVMAMRDSPHLLRATGFHSMEDVDQFLENHAIQAIPSHLIDPEYLQNAPNAESGTEKTRLVFGLDTTTLTAMLSLNLAVKSANGEVCGRARRWELVCDRLIAHIETQSMKPELLDMLAEARKSADAKQMERHIYG